MSNFYRSRIFVFGKWWKTVEHVYQATKTSDPEEQEQIRNAKTPREARNLGQVCMYRQDFDQIKFSIMKKCVLEKYVQHHDLREQLLATGDEELIEDSPVDYYWGCGKDGSGKNMLGKALMKIREELKAD